MIKKTLMPVITALLFCLPSLLKAQACQPPINNEYYTTCVQRLTTTSYSSGGMSYFEMIDNAGGGGIDFEWWNTTQNCLYKGSGPTLSVPADGQAYRCIATIGGQACSYYPFVADPPIPDPSPVPVNANVIVCGSGQTKLTVQPTGSLVWRESSTGSVLPGGSGSLSTGESYVLDFNELTIYHGQGPLVFNFSVTNGTSSPVYLSLSVLGAVPPLNPTGTVKVCSYCSQLIEAQYSPDQTYQWMKNGVAIPNETNYTYTASEQASYKVRVTAYGCSRESPPLQVNKNAIPVAMAGQDQIAYTPGNFVMIANGSDSDGTIVGYLWEQVSGPPAPIGIPSNKTQNFSGQPEGVYIFKLTVTDDMGEQGYDFITITVTRLLVSCNMQISDCGPREFQRTTTPPCSNTPTPFTFEVVDVSGTSAALAYTWIRRVNGTCEVMTGQNSSSFTTPVVQSGQSDYYECWISIGSNVCYVLGFSAGLSPEPPPIEVVKSSVITCSAGQSELQIVPKPGFVYTWSEPSMGIIEPGVMVSLPNGTGYVQLDGPRLFIQHSEQQQSLNFKVTGIQSGAACALSSQATISFTVITNKLFVSAPDQSRCGEGIVTLSASSNSNPSEFKWYMGTIPFGVPWKTGAEVSSENLSTNKTYSVSATDQYGCTASKQVVVTIKDLPAMPIVQNIESCAWESVTVIPENGGLVNWYAGGYTNILQTSATLYMEPKMEHGQFSYEAEAVGRNGCTSKSKTPFTINIPDDCDENLNWVHSITYSTNGAIAESRSYFDDAGLSIQNQTKSFKTARIFASQNLTDNYNRVVGNTLAAPLSHQNFKYNFKYALSTSGRSYNYLDFDNSENASKKFSPDPLDNNTPGTLGWYYSSNNTWEDNVPTTGYPYSRREFYDDATSEPRLSASPGDKHRLGARHEVLSGTFPIFNELNDYLAKRSIALPGISHHESMKDEGVQSLVKDENGKYGVVISDKSGKTVMSCRAGTLDDNVLTVSTEIISSGSPASQNYRQMTYFYILTEQPVSITGSNDFVVENLVTNERKLPGNTFEQGNGKWPVGFYRILLDNPSSEITLTYVNYYVDVSYKFFDDAGRLRVSVSPNGYRAWKTGIDYTLIDKSTYEYNHQGWLVTQTEPDAGMTQHVYRADGKIRFSQNAEQRTKNRFSYTHYDVLGRPVESGEYIGVDISFVPMASPSFTSSQMGVLLDKNFNEIFWSNDVRKDWVKTNYDVTVTLDSNVPADYKQNFVRGAISYSENVNTKTWYSYDELGRVTWIAQKPSGLNKTFITQYRYDFVGNILEVKSVCYGAQVLYNPFTFYHHYEYDADQRLSKVFTSANGTAKTIRATYEYYLHGPLKRIVLGDKIQGIDFIYNIQGWLTQINHPEGGTHDPGKDGAAGPNSDVKPDAFGMVIDYYESSLEGLFQTSNIFDANRPERFHKIPGLTEEGNASIVHGPPVLFLREQLMNNLKQIKESLLKEKQNKEIINKEVRKVGSLFKRIPDLEIDSRVALSKNETTQEKRKSLTTKNF